MEDLPEAAEARKACNVWREQGIRGQTCNFELFRDRREVGDTADWRSSLQKLRRMRVDGAAKLSRRSLTNL
jgi:hypothetical protein